MPLDPFFAERLRVHRRYLLGQAVQRVKPGAKTGSAKAAKPSKLSPRERHRRAALAWDRTELETVGTPPPDVPTEEHSVPVDGYPDVVMRLYRPRELVSPAAAVLSFFGGAFRIGGVDFPTTDAAYRRRAVEAGVIVVAVRYALAPEHRYPTQIEQGYAALDWLHAHADELGVDPARIAVQGTSAGAAIAAAVTLVNRDRARHPLRLQLLEVPVLDLTARHLDLRPTWAMGIPAVVALRELRSVARTYLPDASRATDAYASPLRAPNHEGLPPALIMTAEYDPLRGHGPAYAAALRRAGVEATAVQYDGVIHDIWIFTGVLDAARRWHDQAVGALRTLHEA
ncbi:alpha/beta hydrolase [Microbacterium aoyamense]|uniref:Alpha/beta hydrolase n=1 Tax=Microbacterium aoyamense TaxID=344166 RepID=A0ABN2Q1N8_9MICO|nr:alpha/beta hydrolase [Microbacterium aoyamense]